MRQELLIFLIIVAAEHAVSEFEIPARGCFKTVENFYECRFSRSVCTGDKEPFAALEHKIKPREKHSVPEFFREIFED